MSSKINLQTCEYARKSSIFQDNQLISKKSEKKTYDRSNQKPVIKASICNGEQVAGFKDIHTGKFEEVMLIRRAEDLETFKTMYGIEEEIAKEY